MLSTNLKTHRKQLGLTQQQLAYKLEIKRSLIGAYEEGRATPRVEVLLKIGKLFKVSVEELMNSMLAPIPEAAVAEIKEADLEGRVTALEERMKKLETKPL